MHSLTIRPCGDYLSSAVRIAIFLGAVGISLAAFTVHASEMVYVPMNPSFGGNPNNGVVEFSSAAATNRHKDPSAISSTSLQKTPLQTFNDTLERAILGQLASSASQKLLGNGNGQLSPGTVDTANFTIKITDLGGGALEVTTTDKSTGVTTSFQVGQ